LARLAAIVDDKASGAYTFQVLGSRLKPGCAEQGVADGLAELIRRYVARERDATT
jgi:hypothetical protein